MPVGVYRDPLVLLDELGITEPEEILLEAIAAHCGATILAQPLTGCEARILGYGDTAIITVNAAASPERRRFSAAHELGHWLRHRGKLAQACSEEMLAECWQVKDREAEANRFAASLLLPDPLFVPRARNRPITFEAVRDLADVFRTSLSATAIRLVERGSYPAMVLCCGPKGRKWFVRGDDVPEELFPRREPGPGSVAHRLLRDPASSGGCEEVDCDDWFAHEDAGRYVVREDSRRIAKNLVLTLLWWEDESQLLDLDED